MIKKDFYKGSLETILLQIIQKEGETYGYALTQKVKELSNCKLKITEGTLYPLLHRLENEGILQSELKPYGNRIRKYYKLTTLGEEENAKNLEHFKDFLTQMQQLLNLKLV